MCYTSMMEKQKIALVMITRGDTELPLLKRGLKTILPFVDTAYITLTDPNKKNIRKTEKWCKKEGIHTSYFKWVDDFAAARNFNWSQVPKEYDWIFWMDTDDVISGGEHLQEVAQMAARGKFGAVFMKYLYQVELDEQGHIKNVLVEHLRERLVINDGSYKWVAPIHETLIPQREVRQVDIDNLTKRSDLITVVHLSNNERMHKALDRNIRILEKNCRDTNWKDPRPVYYLGKAYFDLHDEKHMEKAEQLFLKYLQMSGWAEERAQAWEYLSEIYREKGEYNKAIKCGLNAIQEGPKFPSVYLNLALTYLYKKEWEKALHWVKIATKVPIPKTTLVINPRDLQARSLEIIWHYAINTSKIDEALAAAKKLLELFPDSDVMKNRYTVALSLKEQKEVSKKFVALAKYLQATGEVHKIKPLLEAAPAIIKDNPIVADIRKRFLPPRKWGDDEIAIYCGPGFTTWSPKKLENPQGSFLGGSEEAVVYLSRELAKLGWKVTVYNDPGDDAGIYNGVEWWPYYEFNSRDEFNILIGWRDIRFFDGNYKAKQTYLWAHDVLNPQEFTKERLDKITKVIVLSEAHRKTAPNIPGDKIMLSSNGFFEHFSKLKPKNNPHWCIWTSSYDRGLQHLLKIWPEVVKEVPDAQLHIFYGWQLFDKFYHDNPERMAWKEKMERMMQAKGVIHHGRVSQPEVEKWYKKCGIFAYPAHFYEINCISAIKAQLWGAVPVATDYAALDETIQFGVKIRGDIYEPAVLEEYKKALIKALRDPVWQEEQRRKMMPWARKKYSWSNIAKQWDKEFRKEAKNG